MTSNTKCLLCNKPLPYPLMVCFDCSSTRQDEVFEKIEELARKRQN